MENSNGSVADIAAPKSCSDEAILNVLGVPTVPDLVNSVSAADKCHSHSAGTTDTTAGPAKAIPAADPISSAPPPQHDLCPARPTAGCETSIKNRNTREEKSRKKDDKSVDHVLRALSSLSTPEEKLAAMCKKYSDFFDEHRKLQVLQKQTEKRCSLLQREKEQLQAEHSKAILTRSRLENLCRELQRQNKAIKDESLLKIREEEEKRKEVSAKFQTTMNEITTLMQQNSDKNMKLRDDNIDMSTKLKNICEQYELRQQQVERISKQMQLEQQLSEAKLTKFKLEVAAERELLLKEKQELLLELQQYKQRCTEFQATELNLRNQISFYNDKYDEFQKSLARSNDVVGGFKGEMERMTKKICKLEKETSSWKLRWERSNNVQLEMAAAKQKSDQEMAVVSRQLITLQSLCRTLQTERSNLLTKLKHLQDSQTEQQEKFVNNSFNKCNKQCNQVFNNLEPINRTDQLKTNISESDSVLSHYTQDILTSLKESEKTNDVPTNTAPFTLVETDDKTSCVVPCSETPVIVSVAPIPLPDVIETTNVSVLSEQHNLNSALCQRLENETSNQNVTMTRETLHTTQTVTPAVEEVLRVNEPSSHTLPKTLLEEKSFSQIENPPVINDALLLNKITSTDQNTQKEIHKQSLEDLQTQAATESPMESLDCGKKPKEPKKKKK